jgi:hypothetical protein
MAPSPLRVRRTVVCSLVGLVLGASTACRSAPAPTEPAMGVLTLEVAPAAVPCVGVGPRECLQVRTERDAPWQLFYDPIAGFTFEPGHSYVLRVAWHHVPNPPADGSSRAYSLLRVLSKVPAP